MVLFFVVSASLSFSSTVTFKFVKLDINSLEAESEVLLDHERRPVVKVFPPLMSGKFF